MGVGERGVVGLEGLLVKLLVVLVAAFLRRSQPQWLLRVDYLPFQHLQNKIVNFNHYNIAIKTLSNLLHDGFHGNGSISLNSC